MIHKLKKVAIFDQKIIEVAIKSGRMKQKLITFKTLKGQMVNSWLFQELDDFEF